MAVDWTRAARAAMVMSMVAVAGSPAAAQVLLSEDFENGNNSGWQCTGDSQIVFGTGNPGAHLGVPYLDWYWIALWSDQAGNAATGDLTRHGGPLQVAVDIRTFQLNNWNNEPMDPGNFPIVIQFTDASGPEEVSVWFEGPGMPSQQAGWVRYTFEVPDPTSTTLPPGWQAYWLGEPYLPPGRTYRSVLENVTSVAITTAVPGYFYIPSFWEVGFDNLEISVIGGGGCYVNCDGSSVEPILNVDDFTCFINEFASGQTLAHEQQIEHYANCDQSTIAPVLNVDDFTCFINQYANGCR